MFEIVYDNDGWTPDHEYPISSPIVRYQTYAKCVESPVIVTNSPSTYERLFCNSMTLINASYSLGLLF